MSRTALIKINDRRMCGEIEYINAWGGAARIWTALFNKYLKDPNREYHSWITDYPNNRLWELSENKSLTVFERAVHIFTFDNAYVKKDNFNRFADDLRTFAETYPYPGKVDHLPSWADEIEKLDCEAVGLYATSVSDNPFRKYDSDKDEIVDVLIEECDEVYDAIENMDTEEKVTP